MNNGTGKDRKIDLDLIGNFNGYTDAEFHESLVKHIGEGDVSIIPDEEIKAEAKGKGSALRIFFTHVWEKD